MFLVVSQSITRIVRYSAFNKVSIINAQWNFTFVIAYPIGKLSHQAKGNLMVYSFFLQILGYPASTAGWLKRTVVPLGPGSDPFLQVCKEKVPDGIQLLRLFRERLPVRN